jgi:hypothetical protein
MPMSAISAEKRTVIAIRRINVFGRAAQRQPRIGTT